MIALLCGRVVLAVMLAVSTSLAAFACEETQTQKIPAPSGPLAAYELIEVCRGMMATMTRISQKIYLADPHGLRTEVFKGDDPRAKSQWIDDKHLSITITGVSHISVSLHRVGSVSIENHVTPYLDSNGFLKRTDKEQLDIEKTVRDGKLSRSNASSFLRSINDSRRFYFEFRGWLSENVGIRCLVPG